MIKKEYERLKFKKNLTIIVLCLVILLGSLILSMTTGSIKLSPLDTIRTLFGNGSERENLILFGFRLPRIVLGCLVGSGLAVSGCILQCITRNDLADPGILGINSGAGLGVVLFILFSGQHSTFSLPLVAIVGAVGTVALIYLLARDKVTGLSPIRLLLIGVATRAGISAFTMVLIMKLDETQYDFFASWEMGNIWGSDWSHVKVILPWLILLIIYAISKAKILDIFALGEGVSLSLGVNVKRERNKLLFTAAALAAVSVSVSGNIAFVGLVSAHITRKLLGNEHRLVVPFSALVGAAIVSISDMLARTLFQPAELPLGVVLAVIAAPYFIYLLMRG